MNVQEFVDRAGWSAERKAVEEMRLAEELDFAANRTGEHSFALLAAKKRYKGWNWMRGSVGEKQLAMGLAGLPPIGSFEWSLEVDLLESPESERNLDALLIGERIVVFDAKAWAEPMSIVDGMIGWGSRPVESLDKLEDQRKAVQGVVARLGFAGVRVHLAVVQIGQIPSQRGLIAPEISLIGLSDLEALMQLLHHDLSSTGDRLGWEDARQLAWELPHYLVSAQTASAGIQPTNDLCPICGSLGGLCMGP
jgi:hypothetical protein